MAKLINKRGDVFNVTCKKGISFKDFQKAIKGLNIEDEERAFKEVTGRDAKRVSTKTKEVKSESDSDSGDINS